MKRFTSYGPPDPETEFMIQRPALVQQVINQLLGEPKKGGHYFTIFAPRQVGKTTTLRQVVQALRAQYGHSFHIGMATMHGIKDFRQGLPTLFKLAFGLNIPQPQSWVQLQQLFSIDGPLDKPAILILDEFDALPGPELAETVATFRQLYLERNNSRLHGLALIGVHAVLGELTSSMSPFNVQRSLNIPSLTRTEVFELFQQYQDESLQPVQPDAVERIFELFRGQPGLTCWFGELLSEKFNPAQPPPYLRKQPPPPEGFPPITRALVEHVLTRALYTEININIRNLISKGMEHKNILRELFVSHHMRFELNNPDLQWLYLNGILVPDDANPYSEAPVCAFASPFVQRCLFSAFGSALNAEYGRAQLIVDPDPIALEDAIAGLDVPLMLKLYRRFLAAQTAKAEAPWREQPTRSDARAFEAIGHFNLYAWLYGVARGSFAVVPEFPTGNGTADLWLINHRLQRQERLEVKSFTTTADLAQSLLQVKRYAQKLHLPRAYLVVMADLSAFSYLSKQPSRYDDHEHELFLEVIPWGFVPLSQATPSSAAPTALPLPDDAHSSALQGATTSSPPRLLPAQRMALERLVIAHLTPMTLKLVRVRLGYEPGKTSKRELPLHWGELVALCEAKGELAGLAEVLRFTFPELEAHPLLSKLGTQEQQA